MSASYQAFGLTLSCDLPFPELLPAASDEAQGQIQFGEVSSVGLTAPKTKGLCYQATEMEWWLKVPKVARFLVTNGDRIQIDPFPGIDSESLRLFVLTACLPALLSQRGLFLLQANAIRVGDHAVALAGLSGMGKSAVSGAFLKRGYSLLTDGVSVVTQERQVVPSYPRLQLWYDSLKNLKIEPSSLSRLRPKLEKYWLPLKEQFLNRPLPLKALYVLLIHNDERIKFIRKRGMGKQAPLENHIFGKRYFVEDRLSFKRCAELANHIPVVQVQRPHSADLNELVNLIEKDLQNAD